MNAIVEGDQITQEATHAVGLKYDLDTNKLFNALVYDCPELMYWFDKTQGMHSECSYVFQAEYSSNVGCTIWCDGADSSYTFKFYVSEDYTGIGEFTVDTEKTGAVTTAISNAGKIVGEAKEYSDHDKLIYYRDRICQLVSYNDAAVDETLEEPVPYGNPWQIIYVFDKINETNVVCEGYSKAFKLLCDSTKFDNSSIDCGIVTGNMDGGKGAGGHMWNLVSIDGNNYIADITNCDSGTIGYPDKLFLKGNANGTAEGYSFPISSKTIIYSYDASTIDMYSAEERILAMSDYTPSAPHVHTWDEGVVTKEAGCEEDGERTYTCSHCNATRTEEIKAHGHAWDEGVVTKEAGCDEDGERTYTCSHCDATRTEEIKAHGHAWNEGVVTKEAGCLEKGEKTFTCNHCNATRTEEIDSLGGHDWNEGVVTKEAGCLEKGEKTFTCNHCNATRTEEIDSLGGHDWNEGVVTKEAGCEEDGERTYTCSHCDATRTEEIKAHGHAWNEGVVTKEAGCLEKGEKTFTCNHCNATRTEEIESRGGHEWNEGVVTKEASCEEKGEKTFTCNHCNATRTEEIKAHDHAWDNGEITKEATCAEKGIFTYTCAHDPSHKKTEEIPATGNHTSGSAVIENKVAATTEKEGSYDEVVYCTVCHKELSRKTYSVPKLPVKVAIPTARTDLIYNGKTLTGVAGGSEYSVTSGTGVDAGSYTAVAVLKDKNNYTWSDGTTADKKITWKISPASVTSATAATQTYSGSAKTPVPVVKAGALTVPASGYSVTYSSNKNAGTATVKVAGKGNYVGTVTTTFKINPASIAKAGVTGLAAKTYTGKAITQTETVKLGSVTLKRGTDYTVAYKNNIKAATATMTVTGKGNYTGTITRTFKINAASIAKASVLGIVNKNYTGKALAQNVTVKLGTVTLKKGTDYTVAYKNNTKVGTATVIITGKGNYAGTISKTFKINLSGTYRIASQVNKGFSMEVAGGSKTNGANIRLNKNTTANAQKFTITKVGDYYRIINKASGKAVEIKGAAVANNRNIQSYAYNKTKAQLWTIRQNADGSFTFVSALNSSYAIDLKGGKAAAGQNIQLYKSNNAKAQKWIMTAI